jgi:glutathione S-transferase
MTLTLYYHPLSSYCQKVLIALYETETPFKTLLVQTPPEWDALRKLSPLGKFPLLQDEARGRIVAESSVIIEYLELHYSGGKRLVPTDPACAFETRRLDRFFDLYVHSPMQEIVKHRLRAADAVDEIAVQQAQKTLRNSYGILERELAGKTWADGREFSLADCAAAPALYYANLVVPFAPENAVAAASYLARLEKRPSVARVFEEAGPYRNLFPATPTAAEKYAAA